MWFIVLLFVFAASSQCIESAPTVETTNIQQSDSFEFDSDTTSSNDSPTVERKIDEYRIGRPYYGKFPPRLVEEPKKTDKKPKKKTSKGDSKNQASTSQTDGNGEKEQPLKKTLTNELAELRKSHEKSVSASHKSIEELIKMPKFEPDHAAKSKQWQRRSSH